MNWDSDELEMNQKLHHDIRLFFKKRPVYLCAIYFFAIFAKI